MRELHIEKVKNEIAKTEQNKRGSNITDVLPFASSRRIQKIKKDFPLVLGEYVRRICNLEINRNELRKIEKYHSEDSNELSEYIAENVEYKPLDIQHDFVDFLNNTLFSGENIKVSHPYLYNFIVVPSKDKAEFNKVSNFLFDVFTIKNENINEIFVSKESNNILMKLLLNNLDLLKESNKKQNITYTPFFKKISKLYIEDLLYLSNHRNYFLDNFALLTNFYAFMYSCQLIMKFDEFTKANYEKVDPLYFCLSWEKMGMRRKAAGEFRTYKYINNKKGNLFPHIHTMSHLSHNSYNKCSLEKGSKIEILSYTKIINLVNDGVIDREQFLNDIQEWTKEYCRIFNIEDCSPPDELESAIVYLFKCIKMKMSKDVRMRYGDNLNDLGGYHFIKQRGPLGSLFNIHQDFLLLLISVSVKDNRLPISDLFIEFEKRGIQLDNHSKTEVVMLLNKLNLIDKKSDSGDAQYVKSIL